MLCQFAHNFPTAVGKFLDKSVNLERSFREETLTDLFMGALVGFRPLGIEVHFPDEPKTGADMEWIFKRSDNSTRFRLLIQAKRLHGAGNIWSRRSFPEIFHTVQKTGILQSTTLVSEALASSATFPLYLFYVHDSVCVLAAQHNIFLQGVSFASGTFVNGLVKDKMNGKIKATKASSLGTIQPKMFPISRLLCPSTTIIARRATAIRGGLIFFLNGDIASGYVGLTPEIIRSRIVSALGTENGVPPVGEGADRSDEEVELNRSRYRVVFNCPTHREEAILQERLSGEDGRRDIE